MIHTCIYQRHITDHVYISQVVFLFRSPPLCPAPPAPPPSTPHTHYFLSNIIYLYTVVWIKRNLNHSGSSCVILFWGPGIKVFSFKLCAWTLTSVSNCTGPTYSLAPNNHKFWWLSCDPVSILYKSIAGRYRPVRYPDGPITARYRFIKNAYWGNA